MANKATGPENESAEKNLLAQSTKSRIKLIKAFWELMCSAKKKPAEKNRLVVDKKKRNSRVIELGFIGISPVVYTLPNSVCVCFGVLLIKNA